MLACPTDDILAEFVDGRLAREAAEQVRAHADQCPTCLRLLVELGRPEDVAAASAPLTAGASSGFVPPAAVEEYRILRPLGHGSMGQVYLGHDTRLDRPVAIKFIATPQPDGAVRDRFFVEARAIARLSHPNVVGIYRVGEV